MQAGYENIVILDYCLLDHCWTVTCIGYSMSASSISRYKQMPPSHTSVSLVYDSSRGRYSEKKLKKCNAFCLIGGAPGELPPPGIHF